MTDLVGHQHQPEVAVMLRHQQPDVQQQQQHSNTGYYMSETLIHASNNPHCYQMNFLTEKKFAHRTHSCTL